MNIHSFRIGSENETLNKKIPKKKSNEKNRVSTDIEPEIDERL